MCRTNKFYILSDSIELWAALTKQLNSIGRQIENTERNDKRVEYKKTKIATTTKIKISNR